MTQLPRGSGSAGHLLLNTTRLRLQIPGVRIEILAIVIAAAAASFAAPAADHASATPHAKSGSDEEVVFLLHGICKTKLDMVPLEYALKRKGYRVVNWSYRSRRHTIEQLADQLAEVVSIHPADHISFVTHSMGGIIVRTYLHKYAPPNVHRFVMIAPPNQGAILADKLSSSSLYRLVFGPAGRQLRQGSAGSCAEAGIPTCEFAIIAGGRGNDRGMNPIIPGDDDGTVSVESTLLPGARDYILVPYAHPFIHMMPRTIRLAIGFLKDGRFPRGQDTSSLVGVPGNSRARKGGDSE